MKGTSLLTLLSLLHFSSALSLPSFLLGKRDPELDAKRKLESMTRIAHWSILKSLDEDVARSRAQGIEPNCTRETLSYRMEFGSMAKADRKAYTTAISCLMSTPANTPANVSSGAKSRFDDFIVTHILQTPFVHNDGLFFGWHRWYLHIYEQALRTECGYTGPIPYWDWTAYLDAPQDSPIFNGDEYSLGGNGEYIPDHPGLTFNIPGKPQIYIPPGFGGGCVTTGPFGNMTVNLGPKGMDPVGPEGGLGYNPRCLKRDVGPGALQGWNNYTDVLACMVQENITDFEGMIEGTKVNSMGPHGGGHYAIAGDPGGDFYVSPGDPGFYLHHGNIDRLWAIWQAQDPVNRQNAIWGTVTMLNNPPSENATLDYPMNVGYAGGGNVTLGDTLSTIRGPFCYIYI